MRKFHQTDHTSASFFVHSKAKEENRNYFDEYFVFIITYDRFIPTAAKYEIIFIWYAGLVDIQFCWWVQHCKYFNLNPLESFNLISIFVFTRYVYNSASYDNTNTSRDAVWRYNAILRVISGDVL